MPRLDLTKPENAREWKPTHHIERVTPTGLGLEIVVNGNDPYLHGPAFDFPPGKKLWFHIRLRSKQAGTGQLFYFSEQHRIREADSVHFTVPGGGQWTEIKIPLPAMDPKASFRFDPPGTSGNVVTVSAMRFEERVVVSAPAWPKPLAPILESNSPRVRSGPLEIIHSRNQYGAFAVQVAGETMAVGLSRPLLGYMLDGQAHWCPFSEHGTTTATKRGALLTAKTAINDEDGATWTIRQTFTPARLSGAIHIRTEVQVNREREILFLPLFFVLPGLGTYDEHKEQALFAGLEYLDKDEPSSSEADIIGPGSKRQIPDTSRITIPLMALEQGGSWVSLSWEPDAAFAAVFDSPDRLFKSGGHVMGLAFPGSDGNNRPDGSLIPYAGQCLKPGNSLRLNATLAGNRASSIVPSLQDYVARAGIPPVPKTGYSLNRYVELTAAGWLDSKLSEGPLFRHAYPGFGPGAAADAAMWMDWLARYTDDDSLSGRLKAASIKSRGLIAPADFNSAAIGHIRPPVPALVYRQAEANLARAQETARQLLGRFEPNGSIPFRKSPSGLDFGKTHFAPDANGLTAQVVAAQLEAASFCGDAELIREGLRMLRTMDKFAGTVPRGAQTWEVPLHTPDILASANLVRAYTLGYDLTGDTSFLELAKYWAWTGVPFVYLRNPTGQPIGTYATIAVLGATHWVAPNWMGLPVQWCGLVYANALYRLAKHDPDSIWKQLADGITASGIQQTWPLGLDKERQGLLPDSFALRAQVRNDAAINPGTVQANAPLLFGLPPNYDFFCFRELGLFVHAPGRIVVRESGFNQRAGRANFSRSREPLKNSGNKKVVFTIEGWPSEPYEVLLCGLVAKPAVRANGHEIPVNYLPAQRAATILLQKSAEVSVTLP